MEDILHVTRRDIYGTRLDSARLIWEPHTPGLEIAEPTFRMDPDEMRSFLQAVVNLAWDIDIKPSNHEPEYTALNGWLQDMRKLAGVS